MTTTATSVSAGSPSHQHSAAVDQLACMTDSLYPVSHASHYRASPWDMAVRRCGGGGGGSAAPAQFSLDEHQLLARAAANSLVDANVVNGGGTICADLKPSSVGSGGVGPHGGVPMPAFLRHHQENLYAQMQPPHPLYMQDQLHQQHQQHHQQHPHQHQQQQQQEFSHHQHHMQAMVGYGGYHSLAYPTNPHMMTAAGHHQQLQHQQLHHQAQQHEQQQQQQQQQLQQQQQQQQQCMSPTSHYASVAAATAVELMDYDPRELEAFAERFKQRRIKLGVTQADVGKALGNLKLPGVGSLSQSTICRFESLTLSHNNMIALKPVLQAWLEEAEHVAMERQKNPDVYGDGLDKKRKRTSITDAEKRSLEAYFHVQPRPSSEKIAQIAEKLNLKKNVVRVWFCNQRQKQKRMKFATPGMHSPH